MSQKDDGDSNEGKRSRPFDAYDVQKIRLEKLFANIVSFFSKTVNLTYRIIRTSQ